MAGMVIEDSPSAGRDLVPLVSHDGHAADAGLRSTRPSAAFLAQLVAVVQREPQTRKRGRVPIDHAAALYSAAAASIRQLPSTIEISL